MKSFDLTRFGQTIYWSFVVEKKKYINGFLGLFIAYFLIMGLNTGMLTGYSNNINYHSITAAGGSCIVAWIFIGGWGTAELFSNIRTKQQRAMFFMLPATNNEKFWSRVFLAMFYGLILSTAALIAADIVQMLVAFIFKGDAFSVTKHIYNSFGEVKFLQFNVNYEGYNRTEDMTNYLMGFCASLWMISSYILGGTVFKRVPAIMTTLCWILLWIAIGLGLATFMDKLMNTLPTIDIDFWWNPQITVAVIGSIVSLVFTTFNLWLSYRLFTKMQVMSKKWVNI